MIFDQPNSSAVNDGTISDGAAIAAAGIRLTNSESGRIYGGVTFTVGGSTLVNALGGVISLSQFNQTYPPPVTVAGSSGADTVVNAGLIDGRIAFGDGADTYVERGGSVRGLDFGAGDDIYRFDGTVTKHVAIGGEGGDGYDRLVMSGTSGGQYVANATHYGPNLSPVSGFEELIFEAGGVFMGFSGFREIIVKQMPVQNDSRNLVNLNDCLNPEANLTLNGGTVYISRSSLRTVTGSDQNEFVNLTWGNQISGAISLAGGDDVFALHNYSESTGSNITGIVDGGSGNDAIMLDWSPAADLRFDLSAYHNFETFAVHNVNQEALSTATVKGLDNLTDIDIGGHVMLVLADSVSPYARVGGGPGGGLTLEAGSVIGSFRRSEEWLQSVDLVQGNPAFSTTLLNRGSITGEVRLYIGDDLYDGRTGSVGGAVYGNAGNDTLLGGMGAETLVGGFGADVLEGNGGADTLTGGAGKDVFRGSAAGLNGDTITDFSAGDRIVIANANLAGFSFSLSGNTLTFTGGSLTLGGLTGGHFVARAAAAAGVELTLSRAGEQFAAPGAVLVSNFGVGAGGWSSQDRYPRQVADMNGDGYADIVGFGHAGAYVSYGSAGGTFSAPGLVVGNFGHASGWTSDNQFHRELADLNGDGRADIIGFGIAGTWVSLAQANGSFSAPALAVANFGANQGWASQEGFARTLGDVNGDGKADIVGFGQAGAWLSLGKGDGTFASPTLAVQSFGVQQGWTSDNQFHRAVADINGDGFDDIVGFGQAGTWAARSNGDGTFGEAYFASANFGKAQGWTSQDAFARHVADVNGDDIADVVGFGIAGTWVGYGRADGTFAPVSRDVEAFAANQGWTSDNNYHRELADLNGDGLADIVGFGHAGVYAGLNQGDWLAI